MTHRIRRARGIGSAGRRCSESGRPWYIAAVARKRPPLLDPRWIYRTLVERFARNDILTYASAIAVQLLTAVIPLALLAFLLAGELGKEDIWRLEMAPVFATHASVTTYDAVDAVAEGLISSKHAVWLAAAAAIAIWEISGAVRACMGGLNRIFELEETRPMVRRFLLSFAIAVVLAALVLGALLVASRGGGWVDLGAVQPLWTAVRWGTVVVLLWAAVGVVIRFAPNGYEPPGWLTVGSVIVIVAWIGATLVFGWWVFSVANYRTPFGTMIAFLTLIGYLYTSAIVFLVGAQIDQLLIEQARR
jgi:membrane protein